MNQEKIGKFIAERRKAKKLTQQDLAEKLGVSDRTVGNWENGRNMPDLSLFKSLCDELEISINELISGEILEKKDYQKKLEENIIILTLRNKKKIKDSIKIASLIIIISFVIYIIGLILYNTIELNVKYDKRIMECSYENNKITYHILGTDATKTNHLERVVDNNKYLIFHETMYLYDKIRGDQQYKDTISKLDNGEEVTLNKIDEYIQVQGDYDNIIVYYTNKSLKEISKMSDEEFKAELDNSYKMCSLK